MDSKKLEGETKESPEKADIEHQEKTYPFPKGALFVSGFEFFIALGSSSFQAILVIYLTQKVGFSDDEATVIFHIFNMACYFLSIVSAIISDCYLGRFKMIIGSGVFYILGPLFLTIGAIPTIDMTIVFTILALILTAIASGGMKPNMAPFGGDQFKLPEQQKQMSTFFLIFYFSVNIASVIGLTVAPILRDDVHCFGENDCYSLAFGMSTAFIALSLVTFVSGKFLYTCKPPAGNMVLLVSKTIGNAAVSKIRDGKTNPKPHWLDYSEEKYGKQLVEDVKVLFRILLLFLPLPVFWALFDQQSSRWTLQATRMNGDFGSFDIKPDQIHFLNPLMVVIFIPLYEFVLYPLLNLIGVRRPLQKLTLGGILAGLAFIISGLLEKNLEATYPLLPGAHNAQLRVFNSDPCEYIFNSTTLPSFTVPGYGYYENKNINFQANEFLFDYTITSKGSNCLNGISGSQILKEYQAYGMFLASSSSLVPYWYEDNVEKPNRDALVRTLANLQGSTLITWKKGDDIYYEGTVEEARSELQYVRFGLNNVLVNGVQAGVVNIEMGGVYSVMITQNSEGSYTFEAFKVTEPNTINILWLIPQYTVMTLGEVLFSVTGLEFSYAQAPLSMKSVILSFWQLTVAIGNVIVIIVAEAKFFESQASEFYLFAGLMFADMLVFMLIAWRYKPNNPNKHANQ